MKKYLKPKMIMFDYGLTLLHEPDFNPLRGDIALSQYITNNPKGVSPEEIGEYAKNIYVGAESSRSAGFELHEYTVLRLVSDSLGLEYSIPIEEREQVFWENASTAIPMPQVEMMLEELFRMKIRTAVISNISFSAVALKRKIDTALPGNHFEFVIASSEYGVRKPNPLIFRAALQRAGVAPEDVWFCGDNYQADIVGSSGAGMFPVWYRGGDQPAEVGNEIEERGNILEIKQWQELIDFLHHL